MAGFNASVLEAIGNTPIVELNRYGAEVAPLLLAKLEFTNPGGSMKDRAALGMIEWAEQEHGLSPGAEIIISTSGNLGIGMAMTCAVKGYQLVTLHRTCLLYTSPSPRDVEESRMPSSA